jgi:hypothetical protein
MFLGYEMTDLEGSSDQICTLASALVDAEIGQTLTPTDEVQCITLHDGVQNRMLKAFADCLPVISVSKVEYYDAGGTLQSLTSGFIIDNDCGVINVPRIPFDKSLPVKMYYRHGYTTIPQDVKAATIEIAKLYIERIKATKLTDIGGIRSMSDGGRSISFNTPAELQMPDGIKVTLQKYRRVR